MSKRKRVKALDYSAYPLIGYEYEYLSQPVRITRVCPVREDRFRGPKDSHVDFESRYCERSSCDAGELSPWQDTTEPLTPGQLSFVQNELKHALENSTTKDETALVLWQKRRLLAAAKAKR